jgi:hypothetical protein
LQDKKISLPSKVTLDDATTNSKVVDDDDDDVDDIVNREDKDLKNISTQDTKRL